MTYTVVGLLGRGGMAVVELAVDGAGRQVARKRICLTGSAQHIDLARRRIRREAEVLSSLRHPGILPLLDVEDDGTDLVLVMPRMAASLADRVSMAGPMPAGEVARAGRVLLDALATAHRQGIIHRDIKPANVLFDHCGRAVLADFGVAVTRQFTPGLTTVGMVIGTPGFISPEQAQGAGATTASDVFSLGATLGYALTGQCPFGEGEPMALMARAARGDVAPLPRTVPPSLRRPLAAMLEPRPERRPSAAAALGGPTGTRVQPLAPAPRRDSSRRGKIALALLAAALVAVAAVVGRGALTGPTGSTNRPGTVNQPGNPNAVRAAVPPPCTALPYQPCGGPPAPFTDGTTCLAGHADFDGIAANGCEVASTYAPGIVLDARQPVVANLVPPDSVDTFRTYANDSIVDFCTGELRVTLAAPQGVALRVEVVQGQHVLASAVSSNGRPATARAGEPSCFSDNSEWLTIRVYALQGRTAANFRLTTNGSW